MPVSYDPFSNKLSYTEPRPYYTPTPVKTSNYTASSLEEVLCDTSGGTFTVTLPAGGSVKIIDTVGTNADNGFGTNPLTVIPPGGTTIAGESTLNINVGASVIVLTLYGNDWKVVDFTSPTFASDFSPDKDTLIVYLSPQGVPAKLETIDWVRLPKKFTIDHIKLDFFSGSEPTGSSFVMDILENGVSIFSTLLSIDAGELSSDTATTPYVLVDSVLNAGAYLIVEITQLGSTLPGTRPQLSMVGRFG